LQVMRHVLTRRDLLAAATGTALLSAAPQTAWPPRLRDGIRDRLESLRRPEGGYGWESESEAHTTPTFAVIGCYRLLGVSAPDKAKLVSFLQTRYPVPERRRTERPIWMFDFQQVQALTWLEADTSMFRDLAATWTKPGEYTERYEAGGNPVLQNQAMALRCRSLLGIASTQPAWQEYFRSRRRPNGTYNNTPASDGSDGHVMNTLWGLLAAEVTGEKSPSTETLASWLRKCQRAGGGFTWSPDANIGAVEDAGYTWAALRSLQSIGAEPADKPKLIAFLEGLRAPDGLWRETMDGRSNPLGTWYALEALNILGHVPGGNPRGSVRKTAAIPSDYRVWTMQIEAPGKGSPEEAATIAEAAGVHIWAAKNAPPGWIESSQAAADRRGIPVRFAVGNEEYGTLVKLQGLGTYSHLSDLCAPAGVDIGAPMDGNVAHLWHEFRDKRIAELKHGGGRLVWQFNENEEWTRILLDEAVERGTYAALCTFHFGNENFLHSQPFLHRWYGRLPFAALQDAHHAESWWSVEQVSGFRTLFLAKEPTWEEWLRALERDHVMGVRRDRVTNGVMRLAGGTPDVREFVMKRAKDWQWWSSDNAWVRRPIASVVVLHPGTKFEAGAPEKGVAIRVRTSAEHTPQGQPRAPLAELVTLTLDGKPLSVESVAVKGPQNGLADRYQIALLPEVSQGRHAAVAHVRELASKREVGVRTEWEERA
jgi:prenyltransferase beta subunit